MIFVSKEKARESREKRAKKWREIKRKREKNWSEIMSTKAMQSSGL